MSPFFYPESHCRSSFLLLSPNKCVSVIVEYTAGGVRFSPLLPLTKKLIYLLLEKANDVMFPVFQPTFQLLQESSAGSKPLALQEQNGSCWAGAELHQCHRSEPQAQGSVILGWLLVPHTLTCPPCARPCSLLSMGRYGKFEEPCLELV